MHIAGRIHGYLIASCICIRNDPAICILFLPQLPTLPSETGVECVVVIRPWGEKDGGDEQPVR